MIYRPDLEAALWVTPAGRHMRIRPALRFAYTFDAGRYKTLPLPKSPDDPLAFTYGKPYRESLATARKNTGETDAMAAASGEIGGVPVIVLVQDFAFMGGSLGAAAGEAFLSAVDAAVKGSAPAGGVHRLRRRAHAGRGALPDADGQDDRRDPAPAPRPPALCRGADRPHHRRGHRLLRYAGRCAVWRNPRR